MAELYLPQLNRPSWQAGFARTPSESARPYLWKDLRDAWVPALGPNRLSHIPNLGIEGRADVNVTGISTLPYEVHNGFWGLNIDAVQRFGLTATSEPSYTNPQRNNKVSLMAVFTVTFPANFRPFYKFHCDGNNVSDWYIQNVSENGDTFNFNFYDAADARVVNITSPVVGRGQFDTYMTLMSFDYPSECRVMVRSLTTDETFTGTGTGLGANGLSTNFYGVELSGNTISNSHHAVMFWGRALPWPEMWELARNPLAPFQRAPQIISTGPPSGPVTLRPAGQGDFSGAGAGDVTTVVTTLQPAGQGDFSASGAGDVTAIQATRTPAGQGDFSAAGAGDVLSLGVRTPAGQGDFSGAGAGDVQSLGTRTPAGLGSFSGAGAGDVVAAVVSRPAGEGIFSAAGAGDVFVRLQPAAEGLFSGAGTGNVVVPPRNVVCRRVTNVPKEDRSARV